MTIQALLELLVGAVCGAFCTATALRSVYAQRHIAALAKPMHELRGALGALELGLTAMERSATAGYGHRHLEALRVPLERAALAAEDLDASRRASRTNHTRLEPVELASLVLKSARFWSEVAQSYDARFRIDWKAGPASVRADSGRLNQALDNLIANALEHGGGRVLVEGEVSDRLVRILISDGGPGPTWDGTEARRLSCRSLRGHGLAIASEIVRAHRGRLTLGAGGNGRAIVIELPVERPSEMWGRSRPRPRLSTIASSPRPDTRAPNAA